MINNYLVIYFVQTKDTKPQAMCFLSTAESYADAEIEMQMEFRKMNQIQELEFEPSEPKYYFNIVQISKMEK